MKTEMKLSWNLLSNVFACAFFFFAWLVFQKFILPACSVSKDIKLQKLFTEKILILIHTPLNTYFNPPFQVILLANEKACIVLVWYMVWQENQILFTAGPLFSMIWYQTAISKEKSLYMSLLMTLRPSLIALKT